MPIYSVDDIRKAWGGDWASASDEQLIDAYSSQIGQSPVAVARGLGYDYGTGGMNAKQLSSAVDSYQANMYGLGEAVADKMGLQRQAQWMGQRRKANELQANVAASRAQDMGAISSYKDVGGVGDAVNYVTGLGIQTLPYLAENAAWLGADVLTGGALTPAWAARLGATAPRIIGGGGLRAGATSAVEAAAAQEGHKLARQVLGATVPSYPSAVGDVLSAQREQSGTTDLGTAAALGAPYVAANAVGLEGMVARGQLARNGIRRLDDIGGISGGVARAGATALGVGAKEGGSEVFQEGMNQLGRMAVDPEEKFLSPEALDRFGESFVGGFALGGTPGAATGWRRSQIEQGKPVDLLKDEPAPEVSSSDLPTLEPGEIQGNLFEQPGEASYLPGYEPTSGVDPLADLPAMRDQANALMYGLRQAEAAQDADAFYQYQNALMELAPRLEQLEEMAARQQAPSGQRQDPLPLFDSSNDLLRSYAPDEGPSFNRVEEAADSAATDTQTGDLFEANPTSMVQTEFGRPQILAALRYANDGKNNAALNKFIAQFMNLLPQGPQAVEPFLETTKLAVNPQVLDVASQMARDYQSRMVNAMAAEGVRRARPGFTQRAQVIPESAQQMRAANVERDALETQQIETMLADEQDNAALQAQIPERQAKVGPDGQRRLYTASEMGPLVQQPVTQGEPSTTVDQSRQRKMFDSRGRPVTQPKPKTTVQPAKETEQDAPTPVNDGPKERKTVEPKAEKKEVNRDLTANADNAVAPSEAEATARKRLQRMVEKEKIDLTDEAEVTAALDRGDVAEAERLLNSVDNAVRGNRYRTKGARSKPKKVISEKELRKIVDDVEKALGGDTGVVILDSVTQLDPGQKAGTRAGAVKDGVVYLFRDGIPDGVEGLKTIFHELFHKGLRNLIPEKEYREFMNRLYNQSAEVRQLADAWLADPDNKADVADMDAATQRAVAVDEVLAEKAETMSFKPNTLRQLGNWFASVADRLGLKRLGQWLRSAPPTPLEQFIRDAVQASTREGSAASDIRFRTVKETVETIADNLKYDKIGAARRGLLSSTFLRDIAGRYADKLDGVKEYVDSTFKMGSAAAKIQEKATKVQDAFLALDNKEIKALTEFMADVTAANVVVETTDKRSNKHLDDTGKVQAKLLQDRFTKMSEKQKHAYRLARDTLAENWKQRGELLQRQAKELYDPLIDNARAAGNEAQVRTLTRQKNEYISDINARLAQLQGDYFPESRFGEYFVSRKSASYQALEKEVEASFKDLNALLDKFDQRTPEERKAVREANRKLKKMGADLLEDFTPEEAEQIKAARERHSSARSALEELKGSEKDYYLRAFESEAQARRHAAEIKGLVSRKEEMTRELSGISLSMLKRMEDSLKVTMSGEGSAQALRDAKMAMIETYLTSLPDRSAMKRQLKRKNVAGFDRDMQRAVIDTMLRDSFFLSRMEYGDQIAQALDKVRADAKAKGDLKLQEVRDELAKRFAVGMRFEETPIQDKISSWTYAWMLGVSPGYLLSNLMQPFMVSMPMMWARHGAKSNKAFSKAYADVSKMVQDSLKKNARGEIDYRSSGLPKNEVDMLDDMLEQRLLNVTLVQDLVRAADGKKTSKYLAMLAKPSHYVEVVNRIGSALAAYRLEAAKSGHEAGVKYAQRVLADTHFDYSADNAPYWMRPGVVPMSKVLFQFRKYQVGMVSLFAKTVAASVKGETKAVRDEARKQLVGLLSTHLAIGGALGMPAAGTFSMVANLVAAAFGDDDGEPWDAETELRNYLTDMVGKDAADVIAKGLPTLVGADMSKKVGLGDILNPVPTLRDDKEGRDLYLEILASSAGPFMGGIVPRLFEGAASMARGDLLKAAESAVPKWIADPLKAGRFATEGITTRSGTTALGADELTAWDAFLQSTGVPVAKITDSYEGRAAIEERKQSLTKRAAEVKNQWVKARKAGDSEAAREVWDEIRTKVNPARVRNGLKPITQGDLYRFMNQRGKQEASYSEFGGNVGSNAKMAEVGRFAQ